MVTKLCFFIATIQIVYVSAPAWHLHLNKICYSNHPYLFIISHSQCSCKNSLSHFDKGFFPCSWDTCLAFFFGIQATGFLCIRPTFFVRSYTNSRGFVTWNTELKYWGFYCYYCLFRSKEKCGKKLKKVWKRQELVK